MRKKEMAIKDYIKKQTGITLEIDGYFTGINEINGEKYINFDLGERCWDSVKFTALERIDNVRGTIKRIEPNGMSRVAVFY